MTAPGNHNGGHMDENRKPTQAQFEAFDKEAALMEDADRILEYPADARVVGIFNGVEAVEVEGKERKVVCMATPFGPRRYWGFGLLMWHIDPEQGVKPGMLIAVTRLSVKKKSKDGTMINDCRFYAKPFDVK